MVEIPKCFSRDCIHYKGIKQDDEDELTERPVCAAFPDGIPFDISYGDNLHLTLVKDQTNKIVFEASTEKEKKK